MRRLARRVWRRLRRGPVDSLDALGAIARRFRTKTPVAAVSGSALGVLAELPNILDYTGEFGAELILFLPWCNWLSRQGLLRTRTIQTYRGMRCFYDDLDCLGIVEKDERRHYVPLRRRELPVRNEHDFDGAGRSPYHLYPDFRRKFGSTPLPALPPPGKPLLIVHNKYNNEWDGEPCNFIPLDTLDEILTALQQRFHVVYIRHGMREQFDDYSEDEMRPLPFDDRRVLNGHPEVMLFDRLYAEHVEQGGVKDLNLFKNALYSRCFLFITAQGGGAHQIALFAGSCLVVLHRRGREDELAYGDGYYSFMANPAPIRLICRDTSELIESLAVFDEVAIVRDRALIAPRHAALLDRLSPWRGNGVGLER